MPLHCCWNRRPCVTCMYVVAVVAAVVVVVVVVVIDVVVVHLFIRCAS